LRAWDIFSYQPPGWDEMHPCVIVSHPARVANKSQINILMCSTHRSQRPPITGEVLLDTADGLDWETLCRCDLLISTDKANLKNRRGSVTPERRRQIIASINRAMGWV
jgi:hypothetical protein